jgi:hypothetical protein
MPYTLRIYITVLLARFGVIMIRLTSKTWLPELPLLHSFCPLITPSLHPDYTLITPLFYNSIAGMVRSDYDSTNIKDMAARTTHITLLLHSFCPLITPLFYYITVLPTW